MISIVKPMSADHARALRLAYELQKQLGSLLSEVIGRGQFHPGCPVGIAWDRTEEVVRMLEPAEEPPVAAEEAEVSSSERSNVIEFRRGHRSGGLPFDVRGARRIGTVRWRQWPTRIRRQSRLFDPKSGPGMEPGEHTATD